MTESLPQLGTSQSEENSRKGGEFKGDVGPIYGVGRPISCYMPDDLIKGRLGLYNRSRALGLWCDDEKSGSLILILYFQNI